MNASAPIRIVVMEGDGIGPEITAATMAVLHAADDVVPVVLVQVLPRLGDDLMQIEKVARGDRGVVDGRGAGIALLHIALLHGGPTKWRGGTRIPPS